MVRQAFHSHFVGPAESPTIDWWESLEDPLICHTKQDYLVCLISHMMIRSYDQIPWSDHMIWSHDQITWSLIRPHDQIPGPDHMIRSHDHWSDHMIRSYDQITWSLIRSHDQIPWSDHMIRSHDQITWSYDDQTSHSYIPVCDPCDAALAKLHHIACECSGLVCEQIFHLKNISKFKLMKILH